MALDTRYIPTKYFHEIFLDKDTGCPLAGGTVKFFRDVSRTTPKDVFILSGSPPSYMYVNIGSEVTLTSYGTFQYDNNDVTVYLFPYDASGNLDLYYATVESLGSVAQITREGFPNISEGEDDELENINFVPNGQFLLHNDIVADDGATPAIEAGEITSDVTVIAQGGWTFERTASSSAKDFVLFNRIGSYVEVPSKSPRYAINVKNESPGVADTFKEMRLTFKDVNKFASDTQQYTFAFQAKTNSGSAAIEVKIRKFYGTGGDPAEETTEQIINLTADYQYYDIPIIFGVNTGKTIGSNDDDYVQVNIALPVSSVYDNDFDNVVLLKGDVQITEFPDTTDEQFVRDSDAGLLPVPDYEGRNLYLSIRQGLTGMEFDTSQIGKPTLSSVNKLEIGELWFDGEKYRTEAYSSDRIPYRRLYEKWSEDSFYGLSIYGTGSNEMKYISETQLDQSFATSDSNTNINNDAWQSFTPGFTGELVEIEINLGTPAPPTSNNARITIYNGEGTTGFILAEETGISLVTGSNTIKIGNHPVLTSSQKYTIRLRHPGTVYWRTNAAGGYAGGSYNGTAADAEFKNFMKSHSASTYELSSNTSGTVTAAADGAISTGFTFTPVQPNPYIVNIAAVAASGMTAGSYWTYHTTDSKKYIVWQEIDGIGSKPTEAADVYIKIELLGTDTASIVNNKNAKGINGYIYEVPDFEGYFIRIWDRKNGRDPDTIIRTNRGDGFGENALGSIQLDQVGRYNDNVSFWTKAPVVYAANGSPGEVELHAVVPGGNETRSKNRTFRLAVKY